MAFEMPKHESESQICEVHFGTDDQVVKVGGENCLAFHLFEGEMPNRPIIAIEVYDDNPQDWPDPVAEPLKDVLSDPVAWAKKAQDEFGADAICLKLRSTDTKGDDRSPEEAAQTVKQVVEAVDIPVLVYGTEDLEKDAEVMKAVAAEVQGKNVVLGPAKEENYKTFGASAMGYNQLVSAMTPIDVNLAKQLNILLSNLGVDTEKIMIDPTTGALGYGLEYTYSVMERLKLAALRQDDKMTQMPLIANVGQEVWKAKEAKQPESEEPAWGDEFKRGVMWEIITAATLLIAGADIVIMRHPQAVKVVRTVIENLMSENGEQ